MAQHFFNRFFVEHQGVYFFKTVISYPWAGVAVALIPNVAQLGSC